MGIARLQFLAQMRAHAQMLEFKIGDRVSFQPDGHRRVVGMLTRYKPEDRHRHHRRRSALERLAEASEESG